MANGEVQIFLNFSLRHFGAFAILRAPSGEKEEWKTAKGENGIIHA